VTATMSFLIMGLFPLGAITGGVLGELIGLRGTLWVSGAVMLLSPMPIALALRGFRDVEAIPPWEADAAAAGNADGANGPGQGGSPSGSAEQ